jgi:DNA-binding response OmpR family regulator
MAKKILIIEDEEILSGLLDKKLKEAGYDTALAYDGEEGLKKIKEENPDLILLDIIMPKKGGFEVLEEMQKDEEMKKVPVVIVSNSGQPVEISRALDLGVKDYLIKTQFDPKEVIEKVNKQLVE